MGTKKGNQAGDLSLSSQKEEMGLKKNRKEQRREKAWFFSFYVCFDEDWCDETCEQLNIDNNLHYRVQPKNISHLYNHFKMNKANVKF